MGGKKNKNYIERNEMNQSRPQDDARVKQKGDDHDLAARLGFELFTDGPDRLGWLLNMNSVRICISIYRNVYIYIYSYIKKDLGYSSCVFLCAESARRQGFWAHDQCCGMLFHVSERFHVQGGG
jgi:hypothetical protein